MSERENAGREQFSVETDGIIDTVEVEIKCRGPEHLASLIHSDLTSRADEINQIVELGRHPDATNPQSRVDWEGWLAGEYERYQDTGSGHE